MVTPCLQADGATERPCGQVVLVYAAREARSRSTSVLPSGLSASEATGGLRPDGGKSPRLPDLDTACSGAFSTLQPCSCRGKRSLSACPAPVSLEVRAARFSGVAASEMRRLSSSEYSKVTNVAFHPCRLHSQQAPFEHRAPAGFKVLLSQSSADGLAGHGPGDSPRSTTRSVVGFGDRHHYHLHLRWHHRLLPPPLLNATLRRREP